MIYVIGTSETLIKNSIITVYRLFETHTESVFYGEEKFIKKLITKHKLIIKNMTIDNGIIKLKDWVYPFTAEYENDHENEKYTVFKYILLGKLNANKFKLVDKNGQIKHVNNKELSNLTEKDRIINCTAITTDGVLTFKSIDTHNINTDPKFEEYIHNKYKAFEGKSLVVGKNISFDYNVEGEEVRLTRYTGRDKKVILPNFITTINTRAFYSSFVFENTDITEITLNQNLRFIGSSAFFMNELRNVELPQSVEFVGQRAFSSNKMNNYEIAQLFNDRTVVITDGHDDYNLSKEK